MTRGKNHFEVKFFPAGIDNLTEADMKKAKPLNVREHIAGRRRTADELESKSRPSWLNELREQKSKPAVADTAKKTSRKGKASMLESSRLLAMEDSSAESPSMPCAARKASNVRSKLHPSNPSLRIGARPTKGTKK